MHIIKNIFIKDILRKNGLKLKSKQNSDLKCQCQQNN